MLKSLRRHLLPSLPLAILAAAASCTPQPAAPAAAATAATVRSAPLRPEPWLIEDFEQSGTRSTNPRYVFDRNSLGTKAEPEPFRLEAGGAADSKSAAHIWGALGANREPWTWVQLQLPLSPDSQPQDLNAFRSIRFFVKGDGGRYGVSLLRQSVKNYDHFHYEFTAPAEWTELAVPLSEFVQSGWGEKLPLKFDDVTAVQFYPALHDKPFDVWIDQVSLSRAEVQLTPVAVNTRGWFAWKGTDPAKRRGTALDVSRWLDAPAGKHGVLQRKQDRLVFPDGVEPHFWGVNIVASANFPSHAEAEKTAELLAQLGVNMTRHHHMDAAWSHPNVFGNQPGTKALDADAMERFDYFVAQLQKRGIYQYLDLLVHRKVTSADGVPDADKLGAGLKIEGEFSKELIPLQQEFIAAFLGHKNPYTKRAYANDPGVALVEIINEDSLLWLQPRGDFALKSPHYRAELAQLFSAWLKKQVPGGRAALLERWTASGLTAEEDPERGNVAVAAIGDHQTPINPQRASDTLRFLYDTQLSYYKQMEGTIRKTGYRALITGSNHWVSHPLDLHANAQLDFVDRHAYWSHPEGGWGYTRDITWDPSAMVKDPGLGILGSFAQRRVAGLPYLTSEWQTSAPNAYRVEGPLLMAAFGAFTDAHPVQFAFSHDGAKRAEAPGALSNNFDLIEEPSMLGAWPAAALLFHRRDVERAKLDAFLTLDPNQLFVPGVATNIPNGLGLVARTGVNFQGGESAEALQQLLARHTDGDRVTSSTGQLRHERKLGQVQIDTPRTQAVIGFQANAAVKLANTELQLSNAFAVVSVSALDNQPIAASKRLLVSALGNAVNTGMQLMPSGNRLADPGQAPTLVEPIRGKLTLTNLTGPVDKLKAYALGPSGERMRELAVTREKNHVTLALTDENQTLHYEVVR